MGNAALKQHFVNLLETHAPLLVKDLPYDKLLGLSVLGASVTLQRLEIQERVLETFGIFVPFEIDRACLEEVELRLSGLQLQIFARCFVLRCRLRDWDKATREMQAAKPVELPRDVSNQPLLIRCLNSLNLRVQDIEIILQMNDAEAKPWNLGVVVGASVELPLHMLSKSAEDWQIDLNLEDLRVQCARAEQTELNDRGLILGPCDLQIEAKGSKKRDLDNPDQCLSLALALSSCPNCIRINQYQLGLFSRLSHVFILWDALLRSLDLHSMQRSRMKELLELTGQEPLSCGRISISGVFPGLELVEESGDSDASPALLRFTGSLQELSMPQMELQIKVRAEPRWSFGGQVKVSDICIEMDGTQKVRLLDHAGEFYADLDPWNGDFQSPRQFVVRLGDLRLQVDAEEAMSLLILLSNMFSLMLDGEADLMGDIMQLEVADEVREMCAEAPSLETWSCESPWPKVQVSCTDPVKLLLPCGVLQPMVVSFHVISSEDAGDGMCFQLSDLSSWFLPSSVPLDRRLTLPAPSDAAWTPATRLMQCKAITVSMQQQAFSILAPLVSLVVTAPQVALLTRHLRRWGSVRQDAAPMMEKRATLSSSFGSSEMASPRNWQFSVNLQMPSLSLELAGGEHSDPVLRAKLNWCLGLELDAQMLCFSQTLQGLTVWEPCSERQLLRLPQRSSLVVTVPAMESIKEQIQWRGCLAPLWLSIDCCSFGKILDYLRELSEAFAELVLEPDFDPTMPENLGLLGDWENCLQNVDVHFSFAQLSFFLPSSCTQDPKGIFVSCSLLWSLRQLRSRFFVSKLFAAEASQSCSVVPKVDGSTILHSMRFRMDAELCPEPPSLTGRLEVAPISVSLRTEHVPLFLRIWQYLKALDQELATSFGDPPDWTSCSSPPRCRPHRTTEFSEPRSWQLRLAELRQVCRVLRELIPPFLLQAARQAAVLVNTCRLQFDVELAAVHVGMVQSSTDAELAVILVEDLILTLDRAASFAAQGFTSPLSVASPASSAPSPVHQAKRREHLAGHVTVSVDITSTELARTSTLLEPVCFMFSLFEGIKRQPSSCKVSWMNLNLSSALIDTLVTLYDDATERIAGMEPFEGPSPSAPSASSSPIYEIPVNSQGRSLQRQLSISSRQPQLRIWNLLGQDITLGLLEPVGRSEHIFSGASCVVKMPWCGFRKAAQTGWNVKLQLADVPDAQVFLHLNATSAVKSVLVKPKPRTRIGSTSTLFSSKMACYRADTSGSNLDMTCKPSSGANENWVLVRTEVGDKLHELDVHLSSVLFLENRTDLSISLAPYGTPPEGFMELPPRSEPQPIPLDWFGQSSLWVGVTEELKMPSMNSSGSSLSFGAVLSGNTDPEKRGWMRPQRRCGILQPMMGKTTWQAIRRYRSMVANDYFLRSRMLHLSDRTGESCACLCATVCGVSADLQASLQALIFSVTLEPAAQICNRLPCPMRLSTLDGPITIAPGEDVDLVKPSQQLKVTLDVSPCTGILEQEHLQLQLETAVWADRLPREKHQKRLQFTEVNVHGKEAEQMAKLTVTLETEPGLTMSEYWSPLQVRQYSPRSVRLVFFTQYWLLNRRSDCRVCLPHPEIATARGAGMAKFWTKRPNGGARLSLMQFDCNTLRMVSENLVRRGKIQVGLCDQRYNANGESLVPVTQSIRINQPTVGSATAPRTPFNPVQRCFGYTVRPAPLPFYRTLLVEVVRRYTLLNHKEHVLFCLEKDACLAPLELLAGAWASFDPQGANLQIAITGIANNGMAPGSSISETSRRNQRASTVPQGRQSPLSPKRRAVTWADAGEELDLEAGELTEQQEFFSAPFVLAESSRRSFQLMHLCDLSHWDAAALERGALLARPEPLLGPPQPATGIGRAWCLTAVDTLVEQSSVVVRFSEPLRPQFRILNRTGHSLGLRQDCDKAPAFELAPEQRMSFCWFQPEGPLRLCLRLGSQEISYEVGTVEEHSPPLRVEKTPPAGGAFAGVVREEFLVQTKVSRGSREVHIHPHCLLKNSKGHALLVRSGIKGSGTAMVVPHEGSVCLQRESKVSEQVALEIASFIPGSSVAHWSAPIMLTKNLAGHRGFLRHMKSGGSGMTSVFEITMVDVKKDPISDFLLVELRPYVKANCPYFFENDSRQVCSVSQLDGPEAGAPLDLFPGESAPFVPVGAVICGQGTFHVRLAVLGSKDEIQYSTVMDIELPQEAVFGSMHVKVLKERPRHIILRDVNDVKEKVCRKGLKQSLPPFLFLQRLLGGTKPQRKISLSPRRRRTSSPRRRATRLVSPSLTSPSPKHRRPTLPLQMLNSSTPRLSTMPSSRSLGSRISRLRRGSLDIFWTIQGRKRSIRVKGMVFELVVQGAGVTLVDSTSLNEVAYLCADTLVVDLVRYEGARRALEMKLGSLQLDVHDNSAGWRSNVMLRPKRSRLPVRAVTFERPFLLCSANWLALERGAGPAAHFEVDSLKIDMQPIELRLDTLSSFQLAIFGLELLRRAEPLLGAAESFGHLRRLLKTHWRSDGEQLLVAQEGARDDPVLGEPPCPEYDDFDVPTPVFIKQLLVRRIQFFVSVRFNGKASASGNCSSEALQAVDIVLRKLIPFDVSQARLSLGPFFRRRPGTVAPKGCRRCFRKLLFGEPSSDAFLSDEFLPHGFSELVSEAAGAASDAVLRQIPQLLGAQRVLGSPAHLCTELGQAAHLAIYGLCSFSPWLLMAALLTVIAAILESVEGIFMIIAKTTCRITAGTVPTGLRKEPSGFPGALMDLLWYGFPWHVQQIYRECRRQSHIAYSSNSLRVSIWCILEGTWYCLFSILSSAMVIVAKLFQALQLLCHTLAWYVCPERIAELGAPLSRRVGPLLFHLGAPLQYSHSVTSTMAVVHKAVRGTRLRDWRLQQLPGNEGTLLAVQGSGFFLVRSSAIMACVPAREADVFLAWQAKGNWQKVELLMRLEGKAPFLLCFHGNDTMPKVLRLRSRRAALMAFSFAQECVSSWAKTEMTQMAPETPKSRLLRRVHRSAAVRASG